MRKLLIFNVLFFLSLFMIGCQNEEESDPQEKNNFLSVEELKAYDGVIELDFRVPTGVIVDCTRELVKDFEEKWEGKIKVNVVLEYKGLVNVMDDLDNNNGPTMVLGSSEDFVNYYNKGYLVDLNDFIASEESFNEDDFIQSYLDDNRISDDNDHLYGLPYNKYTEVLVYNKTIFDKMGYKIPVTWADVEELSAQILVDCQFGEFNEFAPLGNLKASKLLESKSFYALKYDLALESFKTFCYQLGYSYVERESLDQGYALFDSDDVYKVLKYFKDLNDQNYFSVNKYSYAIDTLKDIRCLMAIVPSYNWYSSSDFEIGVACIPYKTADKKYVSQMGLNIGILNQGTNEEISAAWQLCKYLTSAEATADLSIKSNFYLPVRYSAYELDKYKEYLALDTLGAQMANIGLKYHNEGWIQFSDKVFIGYNEIMRSYGTMVKDIICDKKNISQAIVEALNGLDPKYKKNN